MLADYQNFAGSLGRNFMDNWFVALPVRYCVLSIITENVPG